MLIIDGWAHYFSQLTKKPVSIFKQEVEKWTVKNVGSGRGVDEKVREKRERSMLQLIYYMIKKFKLSKNMSIFMFSTYLMYVSLITNSQFVSI